MLDLGLGKDAMLPFIDSSHYDARHISDHSPFLMELRIAAHRSGSNWKLIPFLLFLLPGPDPVTDLLTAFFRHNIDTADIGLVWDMAKAYLRGHFIRLIAHIKTDTKSWETFVLSEAQRTKAAYVAKPSDDIKRAWLASQSLSRWLSLQLAKSKHFFLQQCYFEEGEITGHMLAMLAKTSQASSHINAIREHQGIDYHSTADIIRVFSTFFTDLYTYKVHPSI